MNNIEKLLKDVPVEWRTLGEICKIKTGKLNANTAVKNGEYLFFTTSKKIKKINTYR